MRLPLAAAVAAILSCLVAPTAVAADAALPSATVFLSPTGSDTRDCKSSVTACKTLKRGYQAASLGAVVELAGGTYGNQVLSGPKAPDQAIAPPVTFRPALGARVELGALEIYVPHVAIQDMVIAKWKARYDVRDPKKYAAGDLTVRRVDTHHFALNGTQNVRVSDSDVGPNRNPVTGDWPQDGIFIGAYPADTHVPTNIVLDGVNVHDVLKPSSTAHSDCVQFTAGINVTIRNSRFENCEHADLMIKGDQGPIDGFLLENNFLDRTLTAYYSINIGTTSRGCRNVVVNHTTALQNIRNESCPGLTIANSIQPSMTSYGCSQSTAKLAWNIYESGVPCGSNSSVADVKYVNESAFDLHLAAGSAAINRASALDTLADDIDRTGRPQGGVSDAGADEYVSTDPAPAPEPAPAPAPAPAGVVSLQAGVCPTRSSPVALAGATLKGGACVFAKVDGTASVVKFWLDEDPDSSPYRVERNAPWDFNGGDASSATPWDTRRLTNGTHRITAEATLSTGVQRASATFTIAN
jgi:hypothetical protein